MVGNEPGMTRDRLYAAADWFGKPFEVVDTGGMVPAGQDLIVSEIFRQARVAIEEAAHLVLVVDGRAGEVPLDQELAQLLRRTGKPLSLAVNKIDAAQHRPLIEEFRRLGVREVFPISAEHGTGIDDLLDHITAAFPKEPVSAGGVYPDLVRGGGESVAVVGQPQNDVGIGRGSEQAPARDLAGAAVENEDSLSASPSVAIIGHPNVGKSTLLNRLLNEERSIVTPLPGTTRDAVDAEVVLNGIRFRFIDTAGIRRKGKTKLLAEKLSVIQARKHLEEADVALLMIDGLEGVNALDTHIGGYAHESGRSVIVVVNKWDAVKKGPRTVEDYRRRLRERLKYLDYAPVVFISAANGYHVGKLVETIAHVAEARRRRVPDEELVRFLEEVDFDRATVPSKGSRKPFRISKLTQAPISPPTFIAITNRPGKLHFSLERFIENRLRERFGFAGSPIVVNSVRGK